MTDTVHIKGSWTHDRISIAYIAAVLPALVIALNERGPMLLPALSVALATILFWQVLFGWLRHSPVGLDGITTAIVFAVLIPGEVSLDRIAIALTFGVVIGEQIFGGRGRAFLNPTATGLVFLFFSFPSNASGAASLALGLAALAGAAPLIAAGLASWRVLAGAVGGMAMAGAAAGMDLQSLFFASGAFLAATVFLACDPVCSASTNLGRLICGFLTGILAISLGYGGAAAGIAAAAFAIFLTSLLAPVIDHGVILLHAQRTRRRRG